MKTSTTISALAFAGNVAAFWRMPCRSSTGIARIDPLVSPDDVADHSHIVFGGGNFGPNTKFEDLTQCPKEEHNCTSCEVEQDKSAYWTPPLYFQHENGTVEMVPNVGGMLAYYLFYLEDVQPFPEGFQMIAGDPTVRNFTGKFPDEPLSYWPTYPSDQFFLQQRAIGYNCLNYALDPEASLYRHEFPDRHTMDNVCKDGLRLEMAFPSCGTGAKDSDDHRSHVAYPSLVKEGNCPEGYDVHYPFLFYETIFATNKFAGVPGEFVLSTGDPVGTSYHADFIMGWDSSAFLGQAIKDCRSETGLISDCKHFKIQGDDAAAQCKFPVTEGFEGDDCQGPRDGLPVGVPVQYGPEPATKYAVPGHKGVATSALPKTSKPSTFTLSSRTYSPANPASTGEAGIAAAGYGPSSSSPAAAAPSVTQAPSYTPAEGDNIIYTTYITKDNEIIELVVEDVEITVTAAPTGYGPPSYKQKKHLEKHAHHHHRR